MRIKQLTLYTNKLQEELTFYSSTLGFELLEQSTTSFSIKVGWSTLNFKHSDQPHHYHYCFLVPSTMLEAALNWMETKTAVIDLENGRKIETFENWNAQSFYFLDASGNVAELIARNELQYPGSESFTIENILGINEIGMPTTNIPKCHEKLFEYFTILPWKGDIERFGTAGDQEGLFLLPNYKVKTTWFPTFTPIVPEKFEITVIQNGIQKSYTFEPN